MNKNYIIALLFCATSFVFGQNSTSDSCPKNCEKTEIVKDGPIIGIYIINSADKKVTVVGVKPGTQAEIVGFQNGDIIAKVDNIAMENVVQLKNYVLAHKPDDRVLVNYVRNGVTITKKVMIGALNTKVVTSKICCEDKKAIEEQNSFVIYPVPAKNNLNVDCKSVSGDYTLEVFDMTGKLIKTIDDTTSNGISKTIDVSNYPNSEYIIKLKYADKAITKNFTVNN